MLTHEIALWKTGFSAIAGVDEVGRGPLAGPVVACACILPKAVVFDGVRDSKTLSPTKRCRIAETLKSHSGVIWALGIVSHEVVDSINILQATLQAMRQAITALSLSPDYILVDGRDTPGTSHPAQAIIKGDSISQSIAAASIIAKVHRDAMMDEYHKLYPEYGFSAHKGYGTKAHRDAIETYGLSPIHRKSFKLRSV